jgi:hypothetical protein
LNFVSVYDRMRDTSTYGLEAAIFRFRCRSMSAGVGFEFIGLANIENLEIAFRISRLSIIERDIQVLPVWWRPSFVSGVGQCWDVIKYSGLRFGDAFQPQWKANFALVLVPAFIIQEY